LVEWIFAFETRRIVSRSKIDHVFDDIVKLARIRERFSARTLDVGGSTVAKSITLKTPFTGSMSDGLVSSAISYNLVGWVPIAQHIG
jgi:hypothetical protein